LSQDNHIGSKIAQADVIATLYMADGNALGQTLFLTAPGALIDR
jgi:hypothetical protein